MAEEKKKKKDYEIIKGDDSEQSNHKIEKFNFGNFNSSTTDTKRDSNKSKSTFEFKELNKRNNTQKKKKNDLLDKHITKKVWNEVKKEDIRNYKKISEKEKDKFIQNMFGTVKERVKICSSCGKKLKINYHTFREGSGDFTTGNGELIYICEPCLYTRNTCENCGTPVLTNNKYQKLCSYCKPNEICNCCGESYGNKELSNITGVKGAFCSSCLSDKDRCWNCGKPVNTSYIETNDNRKICSYCASISLMKEEEIARNYTDTIGLINRTFGIKGTLNCALGIIYEPSKENDNNQPENKCKFTVKNRQQVILNVPIGIRKDYFIGFVASEYGKIIGIKLHEKLKNPSLKEDFAFWVKHIVLRRRGYNEEFQRLKEEKVKSSRFFKWMNTIERSKGAKTVFGKIRNGEMRY